MAVEFNQNGNWLLTASRDQLIKLYDIRTMKVLKNYRGHKKEVTCEIVTFMPSCEIFLGCIDSFSFFIHLLMVICSALAWHPIHEGLFVTGGGDGSIAYWLVDTHKEVSG